MRHVERYRLWANLDRLNYELSEVGSWVKFEDVEDLQKELQEMTARAFAAVWLLVQENVPLVGDFQQLHEGARDALMGKDKERIAKLEDEIRNLQEALQVRQNPLPPAVYRVTGFKKDSRHVGYVLPLQRVLPSASSNPGLDIEVQLP